jgi:amidase
VQTVFAAVSKATRMIQMPLIDVLDLMGLACTGDMPFNPPAGMKAVVAGLKYKFLARSNGVDTSGSDLSPHMPPPPPRTDLTKAITTDIPTLALIGLNDTQTLTEGAPRAANGLANEAEHGFPSGGARRPDPHAMRQGHWCGLGRTAGCCSVHQMYRDDDQDDRIDRNDIPVNLLTAMQFDHSLSTGGPDDLALAMRGMHGLSTLGFRTRHTLEQPTVTPATRARLDFGVYPGGHMFNLQKPSRAAFPADGRKLPGGIKMMMRLALAALALASPLPALGQDDVAGQIATLQIDRLRPLDFAPFSDALSAFKPTPELDALIAGADIVAIQTAMADGSLTSEMLTLWHLARIQRLDDHLRGMLELNPAALAEAKAADARRAEGKSLGPMDGIPITLKDNIGTAGPMHTTANAEVLVDNIAPADAPLVANLRAAGAVIIGKASLSEFAGALAAGFPSGGSGAVGGQGVNPLGPYPTYGSSSGSAISVSAGYAVASIGTETSGSLIAPSAVMSLVAMKPSAGLVRGEGVVPLVLGNDGAGPVARSVRDAALLLAAIDETDTDYASGLSIGALDGVKVGILTAGIREAGTYSQMLERAGAALAMLGAEMHPVMLQDTSGTLDAFVAYLSSGLRYDMMPYVTARHPELVTPEDLIAYNAADPVRRAPFGQGLITLIVPMSKDFTPGDHKEIGAEMRAAATGALDAAFAANGAEVLVSIANLQAPFYATAGYPAITVPTGRRDDGEPSGITLIGKKGQDAQLVAFAYAFEQMTRGHIAAELP